MVKLSGLIRVILASTQTKSVKFKYTETDQAMTNHAEILASAVATLRERGVQYGAIEPCFDRASKIASIMLNKSISPYDVSMVMLAVKLGRLQESRDLDDNYKDAINYLAFAAQFIGAKPSNETIEADIAEFAKKYAPRPDSGE